MERLRSVDGVAGRASRVAPKRRVTIRRVIRALVIVVLLVVGLAVVAEGGITGLAIVGVCVAAVLGARVWRRRSTVASSRAAEAGRLSSADAGLPPWLQSSESPGDATKDGAVDSTLAVRVAALEAQVVSLRADRDRWRTVAQRALARGADAASAGAAREAVAPSDAGSNVAPAASVGSIADARAAPAPSTALDPWLDGLAAWHPSVRDLATGGAATTVPPGTGASASGTSAPTTAASIAVAAEPPSSPATPLPKPSDIETWRLPAMPSDAADAGGLRRWLARTNTVVLVGAVVLLCGVAFLLSYVVELSRLPIAWRLAGAGLFGAALVAAGLRTIPSRRDLGLALQGAGFGVLWLTVWAAFDARVLATPGLALPALALVAIGCAFAAVRHDSQTLAVLGAIGAYAAPVLIGGEAPTPLPLFTYLTVLVAGLVLVARARTWTGLPCLGAFATLAIAGAWVDSHSKTDAAPAVHAFMAVWLTAGFAIALLIARRDPSPARGRGWAVLALFGVPPLAFAIEHRLVDGLEHGPPLLALVFATAWGSAAWIAARARVAALRDAWAAVAVAFAGLAVPLAVDGRVTAIVWAVAGAAAFHVGLRVPRRALRALGLLLQGAAALALALDPPVASHAWPMLGPDFAGHMTLAACGVFIAWQMERQGQVLSAAEAGALPWTPLWPALWSYLAVQEAVERVAPIGWQHAMETLAVAAVALSFAGLHRALRWDRAAAVAISAALPLALRAAIGDVLDGSDLALRAGAAVVALATHVALLRVHGDRPGRWAHAMHALWPLVAVFAAGETLSAAAALSVGDFAPLRTVAWRLPMWVAIAWLASATFATHRPIALRPAAYLRDAGGVLVFVLLLASVVDVFSVGPGEARAGPPLLDPLSLFAVVTAALIVHRDRALRRLLPDRTRWRGQQAAWWRIGVPVVVGFLAVNAWALRAATQWRVIEYSWHSIGADAPLQAGFAIAWAAIATAAVTRASRLRARPLWLAGAALFGLTVVKLVLVDLDHLGALARVVAFGGVGVLMVAVGWLAPLPTKNAERAGSSPGPHPATTGS
jgi:uncharacterized membrane protein